MIGIDLLSFLILLVIGIEVAAILHLWVSGST